MSSQTFTFEGPVGVAAAVAAAPKHIEFTSGVTGTLSAPLTSLPYTPSVPCSLAGINLNVLTAATGQSIIVDVLKNGTSIFTVSANRPTLVAGDLQDLTPASDATTTTFGNTDVIQTQVVQVGSGTAGSNLTVQVYLTPLA